MTGEDVALLVAGLVFFIPMGVFLVAFPTMGPRRLRHLRQHGIRTEGRVGSSNESWALFRKMTVASLEYTLADGTVVGPRKVTVPGRRLLSNSTLDLHYDPDKPTRFAFEFGERFPEHPTEKAWRISMRVIGGLSLLYGLLGVLNTLLWAD